MGESKESDDIIIVENLGEYQEWRKVDQFTVNLSLQKCTAFACFLGQKRCIILFGYLSIVGV